MLIPLSWLKEFVDVKLPFPELAEKLSSAGLTVEKWGEKEGDIIFDPEITPNRPDWLSIYGVAREISAVTKSHLTPIPNQFSSLNLKPNGKSWEIFIKPNYHLVPRITSVIIKGVKTKPSPDWLQKKIKLIGLRPINNLVDITNFVLWTYGSLLHAFDYDKIRGHQMVVEQAKGGEEFRSLDGINYKLPEGTVIIKDVGRVIDLLPLKGGENTATSNETENVLLHSVVVDPILTRRTSQSLGLRSDSSNIAEKGLDPNGTVIALNKALEMILEIAGGEIASEIFDHKEKDFKPWSVDLSHNKLESILGLKIDPKQVLNYFERLELKPHKTDSNNMTNVIYSVTIPTFRSDLKIEEDLIEEVARLHGYNNFPKTLPASPVPTTQVAFLKNYDFEFELKQILKGAGFSEIYTYSLVSEKQILNLEIDPAKSLRVDNPISKEFEYLRPRVLGNVIEALKLNLRSSEEIKLFEIGKEYHGETLDKVQEQYSLTAIINGEKYYEAKGTVELILNQLRIPFSVKLPEEKYLTNWLHPGRNSVIISANEYLGFVGELHPNLLARFAVKSRATVFFLKYNVIEKLANPVKKYQPVPKYQAVIEDLSLIIPDNVNFGSVVEVISRTSSWVQSISLLGRHENTTTLRVNFLNRQGNLSESEVATVRNKILNNLKTKLSVKVK